MSENAKLRRIFRRVLAGCFVPPVAAAVAVACSDNASSDPDPPRDAAPLDACSAFSVDVPDAQMGVTADGSACENFVQLPCGAPSGLVARGSTSCYFSINDCNALCVGAAFTCGSYGSWCTDGGLVDSGEPIIVECSYCPGTVGRRPPGLREARFGAFFADAAYLEAASVHAFQLLEAELARHDAPTDLLVRAACAAEDERRHARVTSRLAGIATPAVRVTPSRPRTLEEIAIENAAEGCVRETFGALLANYQAQHAPGDVAKVMRRIAPDETSHASLAWAIAAWAHALLSAEGRARVAESMRDAVMALRLDVEREVPAEAGLPPIAVQRAMVDALDAQLWSSSASPLPAPT